MNIFSKFPIINISNLNFWLVICIAKNLIWTTLKLISSLFMYICLHPHISANYCPILIIQNHTSTENVFIQIQSCLNQCLDNSQNYYCPSCKERFSERPELIINTAFSVVKEKPKSEALCDICDDRKLKALKTCRMCQTSYCETHLEPHHRVLN